MVTDVDKLVVVEVEAAEAVAEVHVAVEVETKKDHHHQKKILIKNWIATSKLYVKLSF